jgi:DNA-binding response OmpR family regulator
VTSASANTNRPVVLVVDDDALATKAVGAVLHREGFTMIAAADGKECLEIMRRTPVDVLVLDVLMPGMNGLEVCRTLRTDARLSEVPVILLTGCDDFETRAAGMKLGVSEFLCKPFAHHELVERINNQLAVRKLSREMDTLAEQL